MDFHGDLKFDESSIAGANGKEAVTKIDTWSMWMNLEITASFLYSYG